jgi:hypothetical protein
MIFGVALVAIAYALLTDLLVSRRIVRSSGRSTSPTCATT